MDIHEIVEISLGHFAITLVCHFGINLGSFWYHVGLSLGAVWDQGQFVVTLGLLWGHFITLTDAI